MMILPALLFLHALARPADVTIRKDGVFELDGKAVFPIGFTTMPKPEAFAPSGKPAYSELARHGMVFNRCGGPKWNQAAEDALDRMLDQAAQSGTYCAIYLPDLNAIAPGDVEREKELRRVVTKYRLHPALAFWKGSDEPEWGKVPAEETQRFYDLVHELDPRHPVWITQAPRGTIASLARYVPSYDVGAMDVYPVSYPPGVHGDIANKNLSMVGDYARRIAEAGGEKPFWMVLQICFSGVTKPGRTLRFPTFPEMRYMSYQSIIAGARGLLYFGGNVENCWNDYDRALGWNWTFYNRILNPVLEEFNPHGPLFPALVAPDSPSPIQVRESGVELRARETRQHIYVIAAMRERETTRATVTGLPRGIVSGDLLYEDPRRVEVRDGSFTDWFGPNEVHVYRFAKP
jgi:hypothetical protein